VAEAVDGVRVVIPVAAARNVVAAPALTPVPTAPPLVLGLANVRGEVVPVLDSGLLLDGAGIGSAPFAVVVETSRGLAGLAVSAMPEAADVDDDELLDLEGLLSR
jgi:purine-binding chemotaxis protein CheW